MLAASYTIACPLSVPVSKNKHFYLNLNQYRNAHHHTLAKAKANFHEMMTEIVKRLPRFDTINLIFTLYPKTEQLVDTSNVCSIVDKFFSDVLVNCKRIEDDNRKFVLSVVYRYGEVDRLNPRVEATIIPGEIAPGLVTVDQPQREKPMQITINQAEIELAIEARIRSQIMVREGFQINIDLKATRGPEGYQAVIDIVESVGASATATTTGVSRVAAEVKEERALPPAPAAPAPRASRPKAVTAPKAEVAPEVQPATEPESEAEQAQREGDEQAAAETGTTAEEAPAAEAETVAEPVVEPAADAAPAARPSLFGNLNPPQNS